MSFVRSANPIWFMVDHVGLALNDEYYAFFMQDVLPYLPEPVFQDPDGNIPWSDPIEFQPSGTLPNNLYFDDSKVYRIEIRHGNTQFDELVWLIEHYKPGGGGSTPIENISINTENIVSNPQFAELLFVDPLTSTEATIDVMPGWTIECTGSSGSVTITRVEFAGDEQIPTNPSYGLQILSTGWTGVKLVQKFDHNGALWTNEAAAMAFIAKGTSTDNLITGKIVYSDATETTIISDFLTSAFKQYSSASAIPASENPDAPANAFTNLEISWSSPSTVSLSSIQLIGQDLPTPLNYEQIPLERQLDNLFHYYKPQLAFKPIPSLLTGWDFPLNPAQILGTATVFTSGGPTQTMTTTAKYLWDQTIGQSVVGNVAIVRNAVTGGFQATTSNPAEAFYIMQYLSDGEAKEILGNRLAVNLNAFKTTVGSDVTARVYLYRGSSAAVFPTLPLTIGGGTPLAANGLFTKNNTAAQGLNWTLIGRGQLDQAHGTLSVVDTGDYTTLNDVQDLNFVGWDIIDATEISDTNKFAIVVTFECPTTATVVTIDSCGLMKGDIATRPGAQSAAAVLTDCQQYYEIGFNNAPADAIAIPTSNAAQAFLTGFGLFFSTHKRTIPTLRIFNGFSLVVDTVDTPLYFAIPGNLVGTTGPTATNIGLWSNTVTTQGALFEPATGFAATPTAATGVASGTSFYASSLTALYYTADARLGVV